MKRSKIKNRSLAMLALSLVLILSACGSNQGGQGNSKATANTGSGGNQTAAEQSDKLKISVSFYPMYEFTTNVAGDLAEVQSLVPNGIEPHDWEPTPQDMKRIEDSDVMVYNGAGMEGWLDQVLAAVSNEKLVKIEASHGIEIMEGEEHDHEAEHDHDADEHAGHEHEGGETGDIHNHDHDHGGLDPHVWLSPALAIQQVRNIEAGLSEAAPQYKEQFKSNADAYVAKLEKLDQEFKDTLQNVKRKDFITQHAAFGYLAKQYGLTQVPIAGLSPDQEPSAADMAEIVQFAKEHQVRTIFFETLASSKVADTIAKEIGAKTDVLNPIEGLTDEDIAAGLDYLGIMRKNLEALKLALNE